ncbi:hypothetical protein RJ640_014102 [Escallonia rubra]|uniref:Uncharacterized protein n=1 Tax=Escallonia rubra TaxID=112253 RepID=A0AA88URR2_9ASTE|nr:hypothetical protein RJ640_014102 [Escallonia rubra]
MASNSSPVLPVSDPPPRSEERLFKGSAMTKRGAYAAVSYMSCAGNDITESELFGKHLILQLFRKAWIFTGKEISDFNRLHNSVAQHLQPWLYIYFAVLLVLFNKAALSSYSFPCANVITLFQAYVEYFEVSKAYASRTQRGKWMQYSFDGSGVICLVRRAQREVLYHEDKEQMV